MPYDHQKFLAELNAQGKRRHADPHTVLDLGTPFAAYIDLLPDWDADLSYLGTFTDKLQDTYLIDRRDGTLLSPSHAQTYNHPLSHSYPADADPEDTDDSELTAARTALLTQAKNDHWNPEGDSIDDLIYEFSDDFATLHLYVSGRQELRANLSTRSSMREYHYYVPANHLPHNPTNWNHVDPQTIQQMISQYGSLENADIHFATEDYERYDDYLRGNWCELILTIELYASGQLIDSYCVGGYESDARDYIRQEIQDVLTHMLTNIPASITKLIQTQNSQTADLQAILSQPVPSSIPELDLI